MSNLKVSRNPVKELWIWNQHLSFTFSGHTTESLVLSISSSSVPKPDKSNEKLDSRKIRAEGIGEEKTRRRLTVRESCASTRERIVIPSYCSRLSSLLPHNDRFKGIWLFGKMRRMTCRPLTNLWLRRGRQPTSADDSVLQRTCNLVGFMVWNIE